MNHTNSTHFSRRTAATAAGQKGASLLFALITLVALGLAASALVRSVDTGAVVLGNLGAKKATMIAADRATQMAIKFLVQDMTEATRLQDTSANANQGYYATSKEDYDVTGYDRPTDSTRKLINWDVDGSCDYAKAPGGTLVGTCDTATRPRNALLAADLSPTDPAAAAGLEARWLITRLCTTADKDAKSNSDNNCAIALKASVMKNQSAGALDQSSTRNFERPNQQPFYRIVVRVKGPRNAVTYTETIINLAS